MVEFDFEGRRDMWICQQTTKRALSFVVVFLYVSPNAFLLTKLHRGVEEVNQQPEVLIQLSDKSDLLFDFIPMVTDGLTDDAVVLLLDVAGIVAMVGTGPGERDLKSSTPVLQVLVDEGRVVVGVDGLNGHRRGGFNVAYGLL